MKKRALSLLLVLAMCLSMLPAVAFAAGDEAHTGHTGWTGINDLSQIKTEGQYYLTDNVELTQTWKAVNGVVLCLNGHDIIMNTNDTNTIEINAGVTFTLTDCAATAGKITHSTKDDGTKYTGCGVSMNGSEGTGVFNMYGGSIASNTGYAGVSINYGTFNMYGGIITGNTTTESRYGGYGVAVGAYGTFVVSGNVNITGNTRNGDSHNVYSNGGTIRVGEGGLGADAKIGMSGDNRTVKVQGVDGYTLSSDDASHFLLDNAYRHKKEYDNGVLTIAWVYHQHHLCNDSGFCVKHEHSDEIYNETSFDPWTKTDSLPTSYGYYYLVADVTLTDTWETLDYSVEICLNGHSIKLAKNGSVINVKQNSTLYLSDCGGDDGAKFGTITHVDGYIGSGVTVTGGKLKIFSGQISGNTAENGGGVSIDSGYLEMYGGTITGNTAENGGGVYAGAGGRFTMYDGTVSGNAAKNNGGGTYVAAGDSRSSDASGYSFVVYGGTIKENRKQDGTANNVYLPKNIVFAINPMYNLDSSNANMSGADVYVTVEDLSDGREIARVIGTYNPIECVSLFKSDAEGYTVKRTNYTVTLAAKPTLPDSKHEHFLCTTGDTCNHVGGHNEDSKVEFQPWTSTTSLPNTKGNYYLTDDVALSENRYWVPADGTVLCLNGHSITGQSDYGTIYYEQQNTTFTLTDCQGTGKITHESGKLGHGVNVGLGTFNMYGGKITGNSATSERNYMGGGVYVGCGSRKNGTFNMYGGEITGNTAKRGGGVYLYVDYSHNTYGIFNMYGGSITGNNATEQGGGVYNVGSISVSGNAKITDNTVNGAANNVYLYFGKTITIGDLFDSANIGVTLMTAPIAENPVEIATGVTKDYSRQFTSDNNAYEVKYTDGNLVMTVKNDPTPGKMDAGVHFANTVPTSTTYGDSLDLSAAVTSTGNTQTSAWTWTSSNSDVLAVTGNGSTAKVKALKSGTAAITIRYASDTTAGSATTAMITVNKRPLTAKYDDITITKGDVSPAFTMSFTNFASGDTTETVIAQIPEPYLMSDSGPVSVDAARNTVGTYEIAYPGTFPTIKDEMQDKYELTGTVASGKLMVKAASGSSSGGSSSGGGHSSSGSSTPKYTISVPSSTTGGSVKSNVSSAAKGSTVTITITSQDGYKLDKLTVTDEKGNIITVTDKGNGNYTFTMLAGKVTVIPTFAKEQEPDPTPSTDTFIDVVAKDYFYDAVKWAADKGITGGVSSSLFAPEDGCTRAQIVTFLWRAAGSPEASVLSTFTDVPADKYYAKAVAWAVENGITNGTTDTTFGPDETCTRAHGVTFLSRAAKANADSGNTDFTDVNANAYYASAVKWAVDNGITNGISSSLFGPDSSCTRAQIVTFLYRMYQGK